MTGIRCFSSFYLWIIKLLYLFLHLLIQIWSQNHNRNVLNVFLSFLAIIMRGQITVKEQSENGQSILWPFSQPGLLGLSKLNLTPGKHFVVDVLINRRAQDPGSLPVGPSFHSRENICFSSHSSPLVETQCIHKRIVWPCTRAGPSWHSIQFEVCVNKSLLYSLADHKRVPSHG